MNLRTHTPYKATPTPATTKSQRKMNSEPTFWETTLQTSPMSPAATAQQRAPLLLFQTKSDSWTD